MKVRRSFLVLVHADNYTAQLIRSAYEGVHRQAGVHKSAWLWKKALAWSRQWLLWLHHNMIKQSHIRLENSRRKNLRFWEGWYLGSLYYNSAGLTEKGLVGQQRALKQNTKKILMCTGLSWQTVLCRKASSSHIIHSYLLGWPLYGLVTEI